MEMTNVAQGSGKHPIIMVVISANDLAASASFYSTIFGWQMHGMSPELSVALLPAGPSISLRANTPEGFPSAVPFIGVPDIEAALQSVETAGGSLERAAWDIPMVGTLARFKDSSGTIYGLTNAIAPGTIPHIPMPFGANPKPLANTICSLEMYAADGKAAAEFFGNLFGWATLETMLQYIAFDPGAGIGGVFQSHTPGTPALAYIYVEDVAVKLAEIEAAGGTRLGDPMPIPGMACFGYFKDPSGSSMGLIGG